MIHRLLVCAVAALARFNPLAVRQGAVEGGALVIAGSGVGWPVGSPEPTCVMDLYGHQR